MRDFRDAKAMAQTLRDALSAKHITLTHSESLEITARMFGVEDWNTLSAAIRPSAGASPVKQARGRTLPALPIKDATPFPGTEMPFWLKRPETIKALQAARTGGRRVVLVTQKASDVETPGLADVYDIGVVGRVLDIGPPAPEMLARAPMLEGSTQILVQTQERVRIRTFTANAAGYEAEIEDLVEGPMGESPELVRQAVDGFERYAGSNQGAAAVGQRLRQLHDAGRVADVIAQSLPLSVGDKQSLLATLDPSERLQAVLGHLKAA